MPAPALAVHQRRIRKVTLSTLGKYGTRNVCVLVINLSYVIGHPFLDLIFLLYIKLLILKEYSGWRHD